MFLSPNAPPGPLHAKLVTTGIAMFFPYSADNLVYTYIVPYTGWYRISAVGAGGSGAALFGLGTASVATGGGGGAYAENTHFLLARTSLIITPGQGGVGVSSISGGLTGTTGGDSTVYGGPVALVAGGGEGGQFLITAGTCRGGAGGIGSGANLTYPGGPGGDALITTQSSTGGGAAGTPLGPGGAGGYSDATNTGSGGGAVQGVAGGTATGATYGNGAGTGGFDPVALRGTNSIGALADSSMDGTRRIGSITTTNRDFGFCRGLLYPLASLTGGGPSAGSVNPAGAGAGTNGAALPPTTLSTFFGGTGAAYRSAGSTRSSPVAIGGGSGGAATDLVSPATSGRAGHGLVMIERVG